MQQFLVFLFLLGYYNLSPSQNPFSLSLQHAVFVSYLQWNVAWLLYNLLLCRSMM